MLRPARPHRSVGAFVAATLAFGLAGASSAQVAPPLPGCDVREGAASLVFHDPKLLADRFPLRKTLDYVIGSSPSAVTPEALLQTMLDSFDDTEFGNAGRTVPVTPRPVEAALDPARLLDPTTEEGLVPTGLFNRIDLAVEGGKHCGEYRITYARRKQGDDPGNRMLLIFEAIVLNPHPEMGLAGCQPIAKFWESLEDMAQTQRAAALERFYYAGIGDGIGPVVRHENYGKYGRGQVRSNLFLGEPSQVRWVLREHVLDPDAARFVPATVKDSPLVELFRPAAELPSSFSEQDQKDFRAHFIGVPLCSLLRPDAADAGASRDAIVNGIAMPIDDAWNDFESRSDPRPPGSADDPGAGVDPIFMAALDPAVAAITPNVDERHALARAGAMTCGGCHQFSNDQAISPQHRWPRSAGFVHVCENGGLSPALTQQFLPARGRFLEDFLRTGQGPPKPNWPCPGEPPAGMRTSAVSKYERLVDQIRAAGTERAAPRAAGAPSLDDLTREARALEHGLPGAFVPVRRPH